MTNRDKIELPPLPPFAIAPIADEQTVRDYARAAVRADRERRAEQAKPTKPKMHSARVYLSREGYVWHTPQAESCAIATLCWTDDGRAWIDNKHNRELAQWLRMWQGAMGNEAADALDGGVR